MSADPQAELTPAPPPKVELPEEQPALGEARWLAIAQYLYAQLDNIDTLYDACKGNLRCFYNAVARYHPRRHEVALTDGYRTVFVAENIARPAAPLPDDDSQKDTPPPTTQPWGPQQQATAVIARWENELGRMAIELPIQILYMTQDVRDRMRDDIVKLINEVITREHNAP